MDNKKAHVNLERLFPWEQYSNGGIAEKMPERESIVQWVKNSPNPEAAKHDLEKWSENAFFERPGTYIYENGNRAPSDSTCNRKKRRSLKK